MRSDATSRPHGDFAPAAGCVEGHLGAACVQCMTCIEWVGKPVAAMASRIWCSPDRAKAYNDLMLRNREPAPVAACRAPVDKWLALGQKLGVSATPVSYVGSGARVIGARFDELQRLIDEPAR